MLHFNCIWNVFTCALIAGCCLADMVLCSLSESIKTEPMCSPQGKSYPYHASFPPIWNPLVIMDFNNLFRTMDEMGQEVNVVSVHSEILSS